MCVDFRFYFFLNAEKFHSSLDKSNFILQLKKTTWSVKPSFTGTEPELSNLPPDV